MDTRTTCLRLANGALLLHSPGALSPGDVDHIKGLGEVAHIVAPNLYHHLGIPAAIQHWPQAQLWAPGGLERKNSRVENYQPFGTDDPSWPADLDRHAVDGMPRFREWVFFHRLSRTLIVTDLVFNRPAGYGLSSRLLLWLTGASRDCTVSRLFRTLIRDHKAFAASLAPLVELPIERVIMAHGEIIEHDARAQLAQALARWIP